MLIVHNPGIIHDQPQNYCGVEPLDECPNAVVQLNGTTDIYPGVWKIYAAFPPGANPRLQAVTIGIDYDESEITIVDWGHCGILEAPVGDWPSAGSENAVAFMPAQTGLLTEIYWFAGYSYNAAPNTFQIVPAPSDGGTFLDDSMPGVLDPVADFGRLGFDGDPGYLPCGITSVPERDTPSSTTWGWIKATYE